MRSCIVGVCTTLLMGLATAAPIPGDAAKLYFPTTLGTRWVYENDGYEIVHVITEVETKGKLTIVSVARIEGETNSHVRTMAVSSEGLWQVGPFSKAVEGRLWFKLPAVAGPPKMDGLYIMTVVGHEKVKVPAGEFDAIRVDEDNRHLLGSAAPTRVSYWIAPGVGIVKSSSKTGNDEEKVEVLKSCTPGKS